MFHVVTGGSGSGKSEYAEGLILESKAVRRIYIATMEVYGEEGRKRVARHRRLRAGKGFETMECPRELEKIRLEAGDKKAEEIRSDQLREGEETGLGVLLECMSNLAANEMFDTSGCQTDGSESPELSSSAAAFRRIRDGICRLKDQCDLLVVVTNEVFSDGIDYGAETNEYIRLLGQINCWMAQQADAVTEVVYGIPVSVKQEV